MTTFDGVTLLTGASGGLGVGIAKELLNAGIKNIACQYNNNFAEIASVLESAGLNPHDHLFQADLSSEEQVKALRVNIEEKLGGVQNLINLAGGSTNGVVWKLSFEDYQKIMNLNMTSTFLCCREFVPFMREQKYGRIVNVSSIVASRGAAGASHYAASKAAIEGFSKSISLELARNNICVNALALGYMDTGIINEVPEKIRDELVLNTPRQRLGSPSDVTKVLNYLLDPKNDFVTGQVFHVNGGLY